MRPIKRVTVVSTGTVQIRPEHRETNGSPLWWWLNTSRRWTEPLPINVYVIEHDEGLVLFDTGQDRRSVTDPGYFPGGPAGHLYRRLAKFDVPAGATLTERLRDQGYDIADVRVAIVSHLHQDHIGGLRELPRSAHILVDANELAEVDKRFAVFAGLLREHIHVPGVSFTAVTPHRVEDPAIAPFTHAHDVMGDGSLLLLPTPGHTPGSMSLLLRAQGLPPMLFVGDVTYDVQRLAADRIPGVGDLSGLHEVTHRVNMLAARHPSMPILAAHDPAAPGLLATALREHGTMPV
ncbi:glyoxylase-like metal-dependent hydrolase (beta-lactamase superfamily II) [Micromonospora luteifusca]|uniref:Glyoxylase-like metal-dependent hydrolase (Beta-lactamase superfamily II) n=1 Tax=Micromonospora luteifusca TaxID=709860 RepID=A0ABS2LMH3_9ACTN|nr:MBL fold metallo-hydrolase [Micromonospora luteifusca]MBM7489392.1 glyoxylase-like metal-dependent hydrolase (beta-lactamase superfamily II) [Micromonospora luteifusca]